MSDQPLRMADQIVSQPDKCQPTFKKLFSSLHCDPLSQGSSTRPHSPLFKVLDQLLPIYRQRLCLHIDRGFGSGLGDYAHIKIPPKNLWKHGLDCVYIYDLVRTTALKSTTCRFPLASGTSTLLNVPWQV